MTASAAPMSAVCCSHSQADAHSQTHIGSPAGPQWLLSVSTPLELIDGLKMLMRLREKERERERFTSTVASCLKSLPQLLESFSTAAQGGMGGSGGGSDHVPKPPQYTVIKMYYKCTITSLRALSSQSVHLGEMYTAPLCNQQNTE